MRQWQLRLRHQRRQPAALQKVSPEKMRRGRNETGGCALRLSGEWIRRVARWFPYLRTKNPDLGMSLISLPFGEPGL
jgi:hypothetical protein